MIDTSRTNTHAPRQRGNTDAKWRAHLSHVRALAGSKGGRSTSRRKKMAAKRNGQQGGRPRTTRPVESPGR